MPFNIIRDDITKLRVDAIVNAANTSLLMGGGVCGAIFAAAGAQELQAACDRLAPIATGAAVITPGFALPARYIIHTAGPVWRGGRQGEQAQLTSCYTRALELALANECESIAFPLISSGIYGYPKAEALGVATAAIREFLSEHDMDVKLAVFDKTAVTAGKALYGAIKSYIDEHYVEERTLKRRRFLGVEREALEDTSASVYTAAPVQGMHPAMAPAPGAAQPRLDELIGNLDESFSATLLRLIDKSGMTDAQVYRRANIDRRLFSKIRSNTYYAPSKPTVLAFAVALGLTLEQSADLLARAGFALSHSRKFDVIVEYFIKNGRYDVFEINEVLFEYDQPLLGG